VALIEGSTRLSPLAGEPSVAALTSATAPAVAVAGEAMWKATTFELAAPSRTLTVAFPGVAINALETFATMSVLVPKFVGSGLPFQSTTEEAVNPRPLMSSRKLAWRATA
jgi:hypothetical protein